MSIWIRSQDKEMIMACDAVGIGLEEDKSVWSGGYILGTYSTKEKALKVLNKIESFINNSDRYLFESDEYDITEWSVKKISHSSVFQMPQDNEVE